MANLLIQTAYLGDLLLAIPLIKGIRQISSEPLHVLCRKGFGDFLLKQGLAERVFEADKKNLRQYRQVAKEIIRQKYGLVISPHESFRTALLVARLNAKEKIGFKSWWNKFAFNKRIERPMHLPDALRQLSLLRALDSKFGGLVDDVQTSFHNRAPLFEAVDLTDVPAWASMTLKKNRKEKIVFLAPGSTWATKRWTPEGFVQTGLEFSKRGYKIVLIGSKDERQVCETIASKIPGSENVSGSTDLNQLFELLNRGSLLVANDSGLMHMGSLAGIPTVAVFGPTTLELGYRPWQDMALVVDAELSCRPCGRHGHQKCPIGTHDCMKKVSPAEVLRTADLLLEKSAARNLSK